MGQPALASTLSQEMEDFVTTKFYCLHALADGYWHVQIRDRVLFSGTCYRFTDVSRTITFPDRRFPDKSFPGQDLSRTRPFPDNHFPGHTFPGQVILKNIDVHSVCKYKLYRPSHTICRYTEHLLMCACRPAVSIRGLFVKACSPRMGKV